MRLRNNLLLLDTETTGDFGQPLVHDFGYVIIDKNFNILKEYRALTAQARNCKWALNYSDFYKSKAHLYDREIENGAVEIKQWDEIMRDLKTNMRRYKVTTLSAFNLGFDYRALNFTSQFLDNGNIYFENLLDSKNWLCIWNLACETILQEKEYKQWIDANKLRTPAGNYPTNAEIVYKYLTQNMEFEEEHTALSDVKIELEILKYIVNHCKSKPQYGLQYSCWRKVQDPKEI